MPHYRTCLHPSTTAKVSTKKGKLPFRRQRRKHAFKYTRTHIYTNQTVCDYGGCGLHYMQGLHSVQNVLRHLVTAALTVHVVSRRRYFIIVCAPNESQLHDLLPPKRDILVEVGFGVIILQSSQCWVGRWLQWIIAALTNTAGERGQ